MCARPAHTGFGGGVTSGLLVGSKYPIDKVGFHPYENKSGIDGGTKKGVLADILDLGSGRNICIVNTHLQSSVMLPESMKEKSRKEIQEYKIQQRKDQLREAKEFIDLFCKECEKDGIEVNDIILSGDYNTGRYETQELDALDEACAEYDYPAIDTEMMANSDHGRFKELDVPDIGSSFDEYFSHLFSPFDAMVKEHKHLERENESGGTTGTTLDTESFSYKYYRQLIHIDVINILKDSSDEEILEKAGLEKIIDDMMKTYGKPNASSQSLSLYYELLGWDQEIFMRILRIVHEKIRLSSKTICKKTECLDHILLRAKGSDEQKHIFSQRAYSYEIETPIGAPGPLSDHSSVWVELKQKDNN
ncbi:MAG: hypothetical protein ACI9S8_000410 [Chlamydiales bacterium]|jgi:hypothetical protein